jgi:SAM-dependent methyltransferase
MRIVHERYPTAERSTHRTSGRAPDTICSGMTKVRDLANVAKQRLLPRRSFPFAHAIEEPRTGDPPATHTVRVKGWILTKPNAPVHDVVVDHGTRTRLQPVVRPDVGARWPGHQVVGFEGLVAIDERVTPSPWHLEVTVGAATYRRPIEVGLDDAGRTVFADRKSAKLARIEPLLRCPRPVDDPRTSASCLGRLDPDGPDKLVCERCGARFDRRAAHFDFLSDELRTVGAIDETDAISSWGYDPIASKIIEEFADGLVLDAGSGLKAAYYENVVNLEVASYPSADVIAIGERLPFETASFDAVLSLVVLEHVRDPFRCAAEIARVVRPGGRIYVAVPFLQPYHGYPHHYFNMTRRGLEELFADQFDIEECTTATYGLPIFTLTWFLKSYLDGLPPATARRLGAMRVRDLIRDGHEYLDKPFVGELSAAATEELACSNFLTATRR